MVTFVLLGDTFNLFLLLHIFSYREELVNLYTFWIRVLFIRLLIAHNLLLELYFKSWNCLT